MVSDTMFDWTQPNMSNKSLISVHSDVNFTGWTERNDSVDDIFQYTGSYMTLQHIMAVIITPILCAFGILGNVINLIVLTHVRFYKSARSNEHGANTGLVALAISDMLFCIAVLPEMFIDHGQALFSQKSALLYYHVYGNGFVTTFILSSTWITVTLASSRYQGLSYPHSNRQCDNPCVSKVIYTCVFALAFLVNCPTFLQFQISEVPYMNNRVLYLIDIGYLDGLNTASQVFQWLRFILSIALPSIILIFCNMSLVRILRKSIRMRQEYRVHTNNSTKKQNRVTLLLIVIAILFIVLVLPSEVMDFFVKYVMKNEHKTELFLTLRVIANMLQMINFSCNFLLYCALNVHFRLVLKDLCCKMIKSITRNKSMPGHGSPINTRSMNNETPLTLNNVAVTPQICSEIT